MMHEYKPEQKEVVFHEHDSVLDTIRIPLPSLTDFYTKMLGRPVEWEEAITYVDGYGLTPSEQVFKHQVWPEKIKNIYETVFKKLRAVNKTQYKDVGDVKLEDIYEEINNNRLTYKHEIAWIKLQIKRRYVGYWFFNDGVPTYLNGANYFFLNFWKVKNEGRNGNLPDYREYQRDIFHLLMYAYTTKESFYKHRVIYRQDGETKVEFRNDNFHEINEDFKARGVIYKIDKDVNAVITNENRTVNGVNFISGRRVAKTATSCCFCYWGCTNTPDQTFFIQAMNEDQAKDKIFVRQIQYPYLSLPFFFKPFSRGRDTKGTGIEFIYDENMTTSYRAGLVPPPLNGIIKPLASSEKAVDGEEVNWMYRDEPAKKLDEKAGEQNIPTWWNNTAKPATERGDEIIGFAILPSTVGNMESGGGSQFLELVEGSHFGKRNNNGSTQTGLINFLLPGFYAIPGNFIDKHGRTIIEDPKVPVMGNRGKYIKQGAKSFLQNKLDDLQRRGMWKEYTQMLQNYPPDFVSAFSVTPEGLDFPVEKMRKRLSETKFASPPLISKLDLEWDNMGGVRTSIEGVGKWTYSYLPPKEMWNRKMVVTVENGFIAPRNGKAIYAPDPSVLNKFIIAFDPVKFNERNRTNKKSSYASAAVFYRWDKEVDPETKPRGEWVSNDYIAKFKIKTTNKEEAYEEVLKMAVLLGAWIYPERNEGEDFIEWVREKGYDGYLLKDMDEHGVLSKTVGVWADGASKQDMAIKMSTYFDQNVMYMKDWEIIEEWLQMRSLEDLTNRDLAASTGWCQRGIAQRSGSMFEELYKPVVVEASFPMFEC